MTQIKIPNGEFRSQKADFCTNYSSLAFLSSIRCDYMNRSLIDNQTRRRNKNLTWLSPSDLWWVVSKNSSNLIESLVETHLRGLKMYSVIRIVPIFPLHQSRKHVIISWFLSELYSPWNWLTPEGLIQLVDIRSNRILKNLSVCLVEKIFLFQKMLSRIKIFKNFLILIPPQVMQKFLLVQSALMVYRILLLFLYPILNNFMIACIIVYKL